MRTARRANRIETTHDIWGAGQLDGIPQGRSVIVNEGDGGW